MGKLIQFRALDGTDLEAWLTRRKSVVGTPKHSLGEHVRSEVELWRAAQRMELARHRFTVGELACVADLLGVALADWIGDTLAGGLLCAYVMNVFARAPIAEAFEDKWGIDQDDLVKKLAELGPVADHALRYAIACWRADGGEASVEGFRPYGLNVTPDKTPAVQKG